jgi:hypothetical protein
MRLLQLLSFGSVIAASPLAQGDDFFDRIDEALTVTAWHDSIRARLSGTIDLEGYHFQQPPPGLITTGSDNLFNPRLTLFLDAQAGSHIYLFVQSRLDRGFDPTDQGAEVRLDEYALRLTPWEDGRFSFQIGKFATVVGNWVPRHLSWDNPFINAPLIYENITAISDSIGYLITTYTTYFRRQLLTEKYEFNPVIWGPSYASGVSVAGRLGNFDYAGELKNSSLSSRPESWDVTETGFNHPTLSARLGFRPNQMWNFGLSGSDGAYLRSEAESTLPRGKDVGDYHEMVLGQDISFAWHHLQLWVEFYEARFEVPRVGDADTFAWYIEAKYKFTPQLFGSVRWNQQLFADVNAGPGGRAQWGLDLDRIDTAVGYRFTPHTQLKLQYSYQWETTDAGDDNHLLAAQFTVRF